MPGRCGFGALLGLLLCCSCATTDRSGPARQSNRPPASSLPAQFEMNDGAGAGEPLFVTLHLESGEALPFIVDTGAPGTLFDKSLVSKLGPRLPLGTWPVRTLDETQQSGVYAAPKLYLRDTRLMLGGMVATLDTTALSSRTGRHVMGILGMDCLRHYCIQLDFDARKVRFLDPGRASSAKLGKAFALAFSFPGSQPRIRHVGLAGGKESDLEIDTGFNLDGQVQRGTIEGHDAGITHLATCAWEGQTYKDVAVGISQDSSRLGLRFLARHLVTFDFPNRTMYLKPTRPGPLLSDAQQAEGNAAARSAVSLLKGLMQQGRLPGWSPKDQVATNDIAFELHSPNAITCDHLLKKGDSSVYHYELVRPSPDSPWTLHKAWRTNPAGRTLEEYIVPEPHSVKLGDGHSENLTPCAQTQGFPYKLAQLTGSLDERNAVVRVEFTLAKNLIR